MCIYTMRHEIMHVPEKHRKGMNSCIFIYCWFLSLLLVVGLLVKLEFSVWECCVEDLKESMACFLFSMLAEAARQCLHSQRGGERRCSVHLQRLMKWE